MFTPEWLKGLLQTLQQADIELIVVGGQAINLWAMQYCQPTPEWEVLRPYASVDLDFYAGKIEAALCGEVLQGQVTLARDFDPSPNAGVVLVNWQGQPLRIDILASVYGLSDAEISSTALRLRGQATLAGLELRVLHPLLCLEGKLKCLQNLHQQGRQDAKHVKLAILILREFLQSQLVPEAPRPLLNLIERIADNTWTDAGLSAWYRHAINVEAAIPIAPIQRLEHPSWAAFCELRWPQICDRLNIRRQKYQQLMQRDR